MIKISKNKVLPRPVPDAEHRGIRRGIGENFVVERSALPTRPPSGWGILRNYNKKRGFGITEIIIVVFVITTVIFSIMSVARASLALNRKVLQETQAGFLLIEGAEGIRMLRDLSWSNITSLTPDTPHGIIFSGNSWQATSTKILIDGIFDRNFSVSSVNRDGNDDISSSGTNDPGTKRITLNVSFLDESATTTRTMIFYLTDLFSE